MTALPPVLEELNNVTTLINEAQSQITAGRVPNMANIEKKVETICQKALQLEPEEAKKTQNLMADVIGKLDSLAISLENFRTEMKDKTNTK